MNDFWNMAHIAGGIAAAFIVIGVCHKRFQYWATIVLAALSGFVVNLFWEIAVDLYGWVTFFGRAGTPDINDVIRGGLGSIAVVILYLFALRKQKVSWRF